jgi:hypothetical protein
MNESIARCGYVCDLCPAYKSNVHSPGDRQKVSDGWFKYFGFRIPPEQIICDGCRDSSSDARRIDSGCKVRSCTISRGFKTCAECDLYPCETLNEKIVSRASVESNFGSPIPDEDYKTFVQPYEADKILDRIRKKNNIKHEKA